MTEIQKLLMEAIKAIQAEQENLKKQVSTLEGRLSELEQTQHSLWNTQEELGKTQNVLLNAQEEVLSLCEGLESGLITQSASVENFLQELENTVLALREEE